MPKSLSPITRRETLIAAPLLVFAIILGVYPQCTVRLQQAQREQSRRRFDRLAKEPAGEIGRRPALKIE